MKGAQCMSNYTNRPTNEQAEKLLNKYFPVLDHGFVSLIDYSGTDQCIERAARVSYGGGTRKTSATRGLLRYLKRHKHCYAPEMEVLTVEGWKRWEDCDNEESFLVPDPTNKTLKIETLPLEVFTVEDETMFKYDNTRMSYTVTHNHRMWFKKKFQGTEGNAEFEIVKVQDMSPWGHFDSSHGYKKHNPNGDKDVEFQFIGFYLGDGSYTSTNRISFHLKKERKKEYLEFLLEKLNIAYHKTQSSTCEDAFVYWVETPDFLRNVLGSKLSVRSKDKEFSLNQVRYLSDSQLRGLFDGLVNSDGSIKADRNQICFHSVSKKLKDLFELCSALLGYDSHSYIDNRTNCYLDAPNLESRKQYHSTYTYTGKVFCTTTSTGLLIVRGGPDKFGFVCGNSTPFEMVELKFHCCMPIFVARQWIR